MADYLCLLFVGDGFNRRPGLIIKGEAKGSHEDESYITNDGLSYYSTNIHVVSNGHLCIIIIIIYCARLSAIISILKPDTAAEKT
jgi:hypothetical protein